MIVDSARELQNVATEVSALRRSQQHAQALANRSQLVESLLSRADRAVAATKMLAERLGEPLPPQSQTGIALDALDRWRDALNDDLGAALGGELFGKLQESVDRVVREVERRATVAWQRYTAQVTPETSQELLLALSADPSARSTVAVIRRLSESVVRLRERAMPTADDIAELDAKVAELRSAWSTLDVASLDEDVVAFFRAANSDRGAPLPLFTRSVQVWLAERHLESHYVIRPSR